MPCSLIQFHCFRKLFDTCFVSFAALPRLRSASKMARRTCLHTAFLPLYRLLLAAWSSRALPIALGAVYCAFLRRLPSGKRNGKEFGAKPVTLLRWRSFRLRRHDTCRKPAKRVIHAKAPATAISRNGLSGACLLLPPPFTRTLNLLGLGAYVIALAAGQIRELRCINSRSRLPLAAY